MSRRRYHRRASDHGGGGGGHDGGGMMRWLLTYADMITLLTAFSIMMYSMSVINLQRFKQVAIAIRSGFNGNLDGAGIFKDGGVVYMDQNTEVKNPNPSLDQVRKLLEEYIARHHLQQEVNARLEERGLVVSLTSDGLLFDRGQAQLRPAARGVLQDVARAVNLLTNQVLVEGHTCNLPISTARFPSNWELSTSRATTVTRYLIEQCGLDPRRAGAAGYADSRPFVPNDSEAHRRRNRRVNIVILTGDRTVMHNAQTAPATPPPGANPPVSQEKEAAAPAAREMVSADETRH